LLTPGRDAGRYLMAMALIDSSRPLAAEAEGPPPFSGRRADAADVPRPVTPIRRRLLFTLLIFGGAALLAIGLAPLAGSTPIDLRRVFDRSIPFADNVDAQIFFVARMPRTVAGALVGAALAAAGVVFQALLRNPLATPFTLGVSAGASLGAMLAITFEIPLAVWGIPSVPVASFAGSLGAVAVVYWLATFRHHGLSTNVLLLAGVTLNSFFSALIIFVQYLADFSQTFRTVRWLMGDLDVSSYQPILGALPMLIVAFAAFFWLPRALNLLTLGADSAAARGVDVAAAQRIAFLSASLATGAAVSLGGPVGFIGIIVPHLVRLLVGADNRLVLPASTLFGAAFLVGCDVISRTAMAPLELPVGVVTAILGGPFFLWLLVRHR
jgi:ABC-type Fe3+-siderophore transport system permease subunit